MKSLRSWIMLWSSPFRLSTWTGPMWKAEQVTLLNLTKGFSLSWDNLLMSEYSHTDTLSSTLVLELRAALDSLSICLSKKLCPGCTDKSCMMTLICHVMCRTMLLKDIWSVSWIGITLHKLKLNQLLSQKGINRSVKDRLGVKRQKQNEKQMLRAYCQTHWLSCVQLVSGPFGWGVEWQTSGGWFDQYCRIV